MADIGELFRKVDTRHGPLDIGPLIGSGSFSTVHKGIYRAKQVAIKCAAKHCSNVAIHEIEIIFGNEKHPPIRHRNINQYVTSFVVDKSVFIVSEVLGQRLTDWIVGDNIVPDPDTHIAFQRDPYSVDLALRIAYDTAKAVDYLHTNKIMHRDLSCNNILLSQNPLDPFGPAAKVIDFGFSMRITGEPAFELLGTYGYHSPEMADIKYISDPPPSGYTELHDMWTLGVICYCLFSSEALTPFDPLERGHVYWQKGTIAGYWKEIIDVMVDVDADVNGSPPQKDLVSKLLVREGRRFTARQAVQHECFSDLKKPGFAGARALTWRQEESERPLKRRNIRRISTTPQ